MLEPKNKIRLKITKVKFWLTSLSLAFFVATAVAQDCRNFHKEKVCSNETELGFHYFGQSRSALFEIDSTFSLDVMLYGGKDYIINLCTERGYGPVHFRLLEIETGNVFYDNMDDDYYESVGFTIDSPQKIKVEVTLRATDVKVEDFTDNRACVGLLILWRKTTKLGF